MSSQHLIDAFDEWVAAGLPETTPVAAEYPDTPDVWPWRLLCGCLLNAHEPLPEPTVMMLSLPSHSTYGGAALALLRKGACVGPDAWQFVTLRDGPLHSVIWRDLSDPQPGAGEWQFFDGPVPTIGIESRRAGRPA